MEHYPNDPGDPDIVPPTTEEIELFLDNPSGCFSSLADYDLGDSLEDKRVHLRSIINELNKAGIVESDYEARLDDYFTSLCGDVIDHSQGLGMLEEDLDQLTSYYATDDVLTYDTKIHFAHMLSDRYGDRELYQPLLLAAEYLYPPARQSEEISNLVDVDLEHQVLVHYPETYYEKKMRAIKADESIQGIVLSLIADIFEAEGLITDDDETTLTLSRNAMTAYGMVDLMHQSAGDDNERIIEYLRRQEEAAAITARMVEAFYPNNTVAVSRIFQELRPLAGAIVEAAIKASRTKNEGPGQ